MAFVYLDRVDDGFRVAWQSGAQPTKEKTFADRAEAEAFADKKMGARGSIVSTLDMTPEQLAGLAARKVRQEAAALGIRTRSERGEPLAFAEILLGLRNHGPEGNAIRERWLADHDRLALVREVV
jgi:hypothetical protein